MAISPKDLSVIQEAIDKSIDEAHPKGWRNFLYWARQWGILAMFGTVFIAVVIFAAGQFSAATSRAVADGKFQTSTQDTLKSIDDHLKLIDSKLSRLELERIITSPISEENAVQAQQTLREAQSSGVEISPRLVQAAGEKFVEASLRQPELWPAALSFLAYKSFLNVKSPAIPNAATSLPRSSTHYTVELVTGTVAPNFVAYGYSPKGSEAVLARIGEETNPTNVHGDAFLVGSSGTVSLDGMQIRSVVFTGVHIVYNGGPLIMKNVFFVNCTFEMKPIPNSQKFAIAALSADPSVSFSAPA